MEIKITKLKELEDALNPNNIDEGFVQVFTCSKEIFKKPTIGKRFYTCSYWSTSGVQEIINENTFRTYSSIYKWEIINE